MGLSKAPVIALAYLVIKEIITNSSYVNAVSEFGELNFGENLKTTSKAVEDGKIIF